MPILRERTSALCACSTGANTELLARALRQGLQVALALAQHLGWLQTTDALYGIFIDVDQRCRAFDLPADRHD